MRKFYYQILSLFSELTRFYFRKHLRVLAYHDIPNQSIFSKHIKYLKSHYNIISIETLKNSLLRDKRELPDYSLLITFDDGHRNVLENGIPVLKENKVSSCIFIITGYIDSNVNFWWKEVEKTGKANGKSLNEVRKQINKLKKISNRERIEIIKKFPSTGQRHLTSTELQYMKQNNMFIGNHTHTHPMLDNCTINEIQDELDTSKFLFDKWNLEGFDVFAYPNGNRTDLVNNVLLKNGIQLAFLFDHKVNPINISSNMISRIKTNADMPISELKVKASGLHSLISNFTSIFNGRV